MLNEPHVLPGASVLPPMEPTPQKPKHAAAGDRKGTARMGDRFTVLNGFVDCSMTNLSRAELAVWLVLYRDTRNGTARTSAEDIGRRAGTSKRAILDALGKLRKRGLLTRVYRGGLNRGPSIYRVHPLAREPTSGA